MKLNPLGRTGLFVSELCLGTMTFGGDDEGMWGKIGKLQQADAERIVGGALDAGINFIDTADVYSGGRSEEITGQALKSLKVRRDDVVVATKVFGETGKGANARGATRSHIVAGLKASLRGCSSTTSTCTRSTASTRRRRSRKPCARSTPWCSTATCAMSACRTGPHGRS